MEGLWSLLNLAYIFSGFIVGLLVGLTGVGGGSLMTPILLFFFHIKPIFAVGTDLLYASITKSAGIFAHHNLGNIDWQIVRRLSSGSLPAALLTLYFLHGQDLHSQTFVQTIKFFLGIAILLTAIAVLLRKQLQQLLSHREILFSDKTVLLLTVLLGLILGTLVTMTSVGAGALGVTALILLYPQKRITTIVGSDIAHAVPLTMIAGLGHAGLGTVDYNLLLMLLIGSIPGILIGSYGSHKIAEHYLRLALAIILGYVGLKLVLA